MRFLKLKVIIRKSWFSEIKLEIFTSLVCFWEHASWSGAINNRSVLAVAHKPPKNKQARKN